MPQKADEKGLIVIIEEANKSKLQDCELGRSGEVFENDPTGNIIDFESGRKALEKSAAKEAPKPVSKVGPGKAAASRIGEESAKSGKWVYTFGDGKAEGKAGLRDLLGHVAGDAQRPAD